MGGYLGSYGAGEEHRAKAIKWLVLGGLAAIAAAILLYFAFRDYSEERQLKLFLQHLRSKDYKAAYALWGCTDAAPCRDYSLQRFMEDWGPRSQHANAGAASLGISKSCDTGLIQALNFPNDRVYLWVDRSTDTIGFSPGKLIDMPPGKFNKVREIAWRMTRNCKPLLDFSGQ